jgi:hypothetical protein
VGFCYIIICYIISVTQITRLGSGRASAGKFLHESGQVKSS